MVSLGILVLQVIIPLALIVSVVRGREASMLLRALKAASIGSYLVTLALGGLWLALPWYTPIALGLCLVLDNME